MYMYMFVCSGCDELTLGLIVHVHVPVTSVESLWSCVDRRCISALRPFGLCVRIVSVMTEAASLSAYELERLENIRRNQEQLRALGLDAQGGLPGKVRV